MLPLSPPEATGLLALMLLHDSRRHARVDADGNLVLLDEQHRSTWDRAQIAEALPLVEEALARGPGPYAVQAAIAALHCQAATSEDTDWVQIVLLYDVLLRLQPSPRHRAQSRRGHRHGRRSGPGADAPGRARSRGILRP
jgi:RNA polymerase sigma-70 factor (ECF subfamily)